MIVKSIFIFLLFLPVVYAQDSVKTDNKWFTEFQVANSSGFTVDFIDGANLSVGRNFIKNIDLRLNFGFSTSDYESEQLAVGSNSQSSSNSLNTGLDLLHRIQIVKDLFFKVGVGYEYSYSKNRSDGEHTEEEIIVKSNNDRTTYGNLFKLISSFLYHYTDNIYTFVQGNISYEKFEIKERFNRTGTPEISIERQNNSFKLGNLILGAGISF